MQSILGTLAISKSYTIIVYLLAVERELLLKHMNFLEGANLLFKGSSKEFFTHFVHQLEVQSGVVHSDLEASGSHPDSLIRECLKGLLVCLTLEKNPLLTAMLQGLASEQKHIEPTHLADLIARAVQYIFRKNNNITYLRFSSKEWQDYFCSLSLEEVTEINQVLMEKEVATHVLARYRGLAAVSFLYFQHTKKPLRIADIGCSLNFGLRAAVRGTILQRELDTLNDMTGDQLLLHSVKAKRPVIEYALGIDIQEPDLEWVAACAYFSKYDENRKMLKRYLDLIQKDSDNGSPIYSLIGDISDTSTATKIAKTHTKDFHVMYGSMVMYQLSKKMAAQALQNINTLLANQGMFVELTFKNPQNWFLPWNTVTTIRFKENGALTKAYHWVEWDSSRCLSVRESEDFQEVNLRIANLETSD